jgi:translation initiation factor eIF-2B subunit delta
LMCFSSSVVEAILLAGKAANLNFKVIIVDSHPYLEGKKMLVRLSAAGIDLTYCHVEALGLVIRSATKVLIGASALFSNGALLARAGTALVCLLAKQHSLPVIVAAQACKFSEKVGLLASEASGGATMYDVTPAEYLTMIITEMGMLPVTSVPVVNREYNIAQTNI